MDLASLLANERRARLAAERLLEMRQRELRAANHKLAEQSRALTRQVMRKRDEFESIQTETELLRREYDQIGKDLARATSAAEQAQDRLWLALQSMRDGFALFDADHRLLSANKAYLSIFDGLDCMRPGIPYRDILQILVEEGIIDTQGPAADWVAAMLKRWTQPEPRPEVLRLWNGQFVKLLDRRTPDGGTVSLGVNQTDQLRMWAAVEAIPDGFVLYDQEERLVMSNARYREIYPESAEAMVPGASFEDILRHGLKRGQHRDAVGREEEWLEQRLMEHRRPSRSVEQHLGDGRWLRVLEKATPDGGRVGLRVDITSIKEQQAALERERERAEAANRAKSAFLANMSHELRTPMNGVVGMAELLRADPLTPEQELYVTTIKTSGEALLSVLNDILDFSMIEQGRATLARAPFDLEHCLLDVVRLLQPGTSGRPLDLSFDFSPLQPRRVLGDKGRVRQILTNLVGNAIKFTPAGKIAVQVWPEGKGVRITVTDTGIGIPEDKIDHVFGEFTQVEDGRDRTYDGTGLGLAICRQLATQMGGSIGVVSALGKGSCFTLVLPLAPAPEDDAPSPAAPPPGPACDAFRLSVLAAEDNKTNQLVLAKMLKDAHVDLRIVGNGSAAVAAFAAAPPDLVFMDISMPGMDGREAARRIRSHETAHGLPRTPIIAMTAHSSDSEKAEIAAAGIDHHLAKPLDRAALLGHVEALRAARQAAG